MESNLIQFDWAIKNVLRNKANFNVLSGFLTELLKKKIEVIELIESEGNKETADDKTNKLDLIAKIDNGEIAIFEVQTSKEHDFFHRILYGASRAVTQQLTEGKKYGDIKKVYSIDIVYFELGKGTDYIYRGITDFRGIHNNETLMLSESEMKFLPQESTTQSASSLFPEYYLIYPKRFNNDAIKTKFDEWVYVLKNSAVKKEFSAAGVKEAGKALDKAKMTPAQRQMYEDYLKSERVKEDEIESARFEGKTEGLAEGKAEGRMEEKIETAKNLKKMGLSAEQIAQATGLSVHEIENL